MLRAGLPHFDVLVTPSADVHFFATLAAVFELSEPEEDDPKSLAILKGNVESQRKTTTEELGKFVTSVTEYEQQIAAMQVMCCSCPPLAWVEICRFLARLPLRLVGVYKGGKWLWQDRE